MHSSPIAATDAPGDMPTSIWRHGKRASSANGSSDGRPKISAIPRACDASGFASPLPRPNAGARGSPADSWLNGNQEQHAEQRRLDHGAVHQPRR